MIYSLHTRLTRSFLLCAISVFSCVLGGASVPSFINQPLKPTARAEVISVRPASEVDVVYLGGGFDQGFRIGTECQVIRDSQWVAEVVLVDVRPAHAAGLILELNPKTAIQSGDLVRIKVIQPAN